MASTLIGETLLHYRITAKLGEGGMGEVYRAEDTRLDREVAIKVLPATVGESSEFRARFDREAKTISSLNHPNICTLFDVGEENGRHFLVMELIEGESLAERLASGPLPLDQVLRYGAQVAEALDEAHKKGIVHRDLKPGNVMITGSGAKLVDFGLARTGAESQPIQGMTQMPTEAQPLTAEGTILGTFQYMAPEQLEGLEADARTDIFALGALLYEMATGKRAFEAETRTSLIAAIVSSQPAPISTVTTVAPPALDHIVARCLEKDPEERWQSARDIASELRWVSESGSQVSETAAAAAAAQRKRHWPGVAAVIGWVLALGALAWIGFGTTSDEPDTSVLRSDLVESPEALYRHLANGAKQLSPAGDRLAYSSGRGLAVRDLRSGKTEVLEGTDGAGFPFWSPDGEWLAFFADQKLKKIMVDGGPAQTLAEAPNSRGGTWSADGVIVYSPDLYQGLMQVPASGGEATSATTLPGPDTTHRNPNFLPDGRRFLFTERATLNERAARLVLGSLDGSTPVVLMEDVTNTQWVDGFLFFVREGTLFAQQFDLERLEATGAAVPIANSVASYNSRDLADFSVSRGGTLTYREEGLSLARAVWYDHSGYQVGVLTEPASLLGLGGLDAGATIATTMRFNDSGSHSDVAAIDLTTGRLTRVTFEESVREIFSTPSGSGTRLAITGTRKDTGQATLWLQDATGQGNDEILLEGNSFLVFDWSTDERYLLGTLQRSATKHDIAYVDLTSGSLDPVPIVATEFREASPTLSPDGQWLAYDSEETGGRDVFVVDFPAAERKWQVSHGGRRPRWNTDGSGLFYENWGSLWKVKQQADPRRPFGEPELLFAADGSRANLAGFVPIGDRILALERLPGQSEPVRMIRNWRQLLQDLGGI
jgi:serine/threonine protein kinase